MPAKKAHNALGRGLGALLGDEVEKTIEDEVSSESVAYLPITAIDVNIDQPRRAFDEISLKELAASIASVGVLQPIIVCREGERYVIVAGERRYRASRLAGMTEIPAIVRDFEKQTRLEAALIENLQRSDLNPIEEARGVKRLMDETGLTQEAAAERLGKSRSALANLVRLLTLPESVIKLILDNKLTAGHARALVAVDRHKQEKLAELCAAQGWSVRQFEKICQNAQGEENVKPEKPKRDPQIKELETMVRNNVGVRARIDGDLKQGKVILSYYSEDELQRVWDAISRLS